MGDGYNNVLNRKGKIAILLLVDILIITVSCLLSILLMHKWHPVGTNTAINIIGVSILVYIVTLWAFKSYKSIWSNVGVYEIINCSKACAVAGVVDIILIRTMNDDLTLLSIVLPTTLILILCNGARLSLRIAHKIMLDISYNNKNNYEKVNVLIIGAGAWGDTIIREIKREKSNEYNIVGIIDDDKNKHNTLVDGLKVLGGRDIIEKVAKENDVKEIFFSIAKMNMKDKGEIIDICSKTKANTKMIPGIYELLDGKVSVSKFRRVDLKN